MIQDTIIRQTVEELYPTATLEQRFKLRKAMAEVLEDRRNGHDKPICPHRARMVSTFNKHYQKALRADVK